MAAFKLSAKAKADLKKIAIFTEENWGCEQRNHYLLQFDDCFHKIAENINIGQSCDFIKQGYRRFPQGSHVIFYKKGNHDFVEIIRILHKGMDMTSHL